jgi:exodeoxyribonuclease VII large subunit
MAKPVNTQWDFGELFAKQSTSAPEPGPQAPAAAPPAQPLKPSRKVLSVSELASQIRRILEGQIGHVWVTGEITNLRNQSSGHVYFTVKDANAQLSCVLFRGELFVDRTLLQDGRKVTLGGELTVYETRGQYQLRVTQAEAQGAGALQAAFERLKQKLNAEGLFAKERKRPMPRFPQRIGLVTSPTGAAIRDVLHVIERRNPSLEILLAPCRVQGDGAGVEVAAAIELLNEYNSAQSKIADSQLPITSYQTLDLILVTRGGGSPEDLWAFNEEVVARAIFHSTLPVVSAIGHEIDFTISDFVADIRAATPSAAAEIITEGVFSSCQFVAEVGARIGQLARQQMQDKRDILLQFRQCLERLHPRRKFNDWLQRLDDLQGTLQRCAEQGVKRQRLACRNLSERLLRVRPAILLKQRREVLRQETERLHEQTRHRMRELKNRISTVESRLRLLGPEQVLARGYSITLDAESGKVLREAEAVEKGKKIRTKLKAGEIISTVDSCKSDQSESRPINPEAKAAEDSRTPKR